MLQHVARQHTVVGYPIAEPISNERMLTTPCDILVPAALERQITGANAARLQCRILAEAATRARAEQIVGTYRDRLKEWLGVGVEA
jgi:glutamate dehydrogenase/leucine dehydrogenase